MAATLNDIRIKVRRLTRSPTTSQLTNQQLDDYINTFILYDMPSHLRLFSLRTTFSFYTKPYVDVYETNTTDPNDPLFNFKNKYITTHEPLYIAGYEAFFTQSREQFFRLYPNVTFLNQVAAGDGVTQAFAGTLTGIPVLTNNVLFSSVDVNNAGLAVIDVPNDPFDGAGTLIVPNNPAPVGAINYVTGVFNFTYPIAPADGQAINSQTVPYQAALPFAMCYFDDKFILRPVPDQPYKVDMEVYVQPTELLTIDQEPNLRQWWQYIAYGAAKKILEDRMDLDSVQMIMPEFKTQELLVLRTTIVQQTKERVSTIYTDQGLYGGGPGNGWGWGGGIF